VRPNSLDDEIFFDTKAPSIVPARLGAVLGEIVPPHQG
jgi:hypothetical protein